MDGRAITRSWLGLALCALVSFAMQAPASTTTQKSDTSKKTPHHASTHSASTHSAASSRKSASTHASGTHASAKPASSKGKHSRGKARTKTARKRGQQIIDSERARQIQQALIREHYLSGEPTGTWDSATQAAMQRYQADQGWQSKTTPDARALIKLGLGPSPEHLLNPESAMTSLPASTTARSDPPAKADAKANASDPVPSPATKAPTGDTPQQ